ncbi:MAG: ATP-binding protein [Bacteroidota bacterium]
MSPPFASDAEPPRPGPVRRDTNLRERAESVLAGQSASTSEASPAPEQADPSQAELLEELRIYQVELELQNHELRAAQAELDRSNQELNSLFNEAPVGYFVFDAHGAVFNVNDTALNMLGQSRQRVQYRPFVVHLMQASKSRFHLHLEEVMARKTLTTCEVILRQHDRPPIHAQLHSVVLQTPQGPRIRTTMLDVTAQRRLEQALVEAQEEAVSSMHFQSSMLANLSHEIRTPLASILGFSEVIDELVEPELKEFTELIQLSGQRLLATLNSVLDYARFQAGQQSAELETVDLAQELRELEETYRGLASQRGLDLRVEAPDGPLYALVDTGFFGRVLDNLISNAVKYTEAGHIRVQVSGQGSMVAVAVEDTGIGMEPAFLSRLFQPFVQAHTSDDAGHRQGVGLGLAITKHLVELMQGSIVVESEEGQGSRFEVRFPRVANVPFPPAPADVLPPVELAETSLRLLVIDNDESTRRLLGLLLRDLCQPVFAATTAEGLHHLREGTHDVVLLDIKLDGDASGIDLLHELRGRAASSEAYVVAFTAFAMPHDRQQFLHMGFDDYLSKPFSRRDVQTVLQRALEAKASE